VSGLPPLFFVNSESPGDRARFSLAHEVGHVIMHRNPHAEQERQADQFASAFLMPARDIAAYLKPLSIERAAAIKPYWRVSMAAIIKRAYDLGMIGHSYYRKLFTQLSKVGYRTDEPNPVEVEQPTVVDDLIGVHMRELKYSEPEMGRLVMQTVHR